MQFRDLKKQYESLKPQMDAAVSEVLTEANYISGRQVAQLVRGFGMDVCYYDPYPVQGQEPARPVGLDELLSTSDFISVHARAEEYVPSCREQYDIAASRAVAELRTLSELCLPYVKPGGLFLAMKSVGTEEELTAKAARALDEMMHFGVTTCEAKSGYGLDREDELQVVLRASSPRFWERINPRAIVDNVTVVGPDGTRYAADSNKYHDGLKKPDPAVWANMFSEWDIGWREVAFFLPAEGWRPGDQVTLELDSEVGRIVLSTAVTERVEMS